ncbi:MAG: hypothetical protein A2854_04960 [Parcubacteria group bacterium RIFCSPHIGHO2_01_FULL_56_18]|nr:MAG: hypothetical protein A2854_04960 [Parcubacteria group bacterium RIFCSPHIGHO2_01_FULL_56_18]
MKELALTIKTEVVIIPGKTRVQLVPPVGGGGDYDSMCFFETYAGKEGTVVGYNIEYAGILDHRGREPGTYVCIDGYDGSPEAFTPLRILFDGESEPRDVKITHLRVVSDYRVVADSDERLLATAGYLGRLPYPIEFYPEDRVSLQSDLLRSERNIISMRFDTDGRVQYSVDHSQEERQAIKERERAVDSNQALCMRAFSTSDMPKAWMGADELVLVGRGNIYHLHESGPDDVNFESVEEEIAFWSSLRVACVIHDTRNWRLQKPQRLADTLARIQRGEADTVFHIENMVPYSYEPMRLFSRFEKFRVRAQRASLAYWQTQEDVGLSDRSRA